MFFQVNYCMEEGSELSVSQLIELLFGVMAFIILLIFVAVILSSFQEAKHTQYALSAKIIAREISDLDCYGGSNSNKNTFNRIPEFFVKEEEKEADNEDDFDYANSDWDRSHVLYYTKDSEVAGFNLIDNKLLLKESQCRNMEYCVCMIGENFQTLKDSCAEIISNFSDIEFVFQVHDDLKDGSSKSVNINSENSENVWKSIPISCVFDKKFVNGEKVHIINVGIGDFGNPGSRPTIPMYEGSSSVN